MPIIKCIVILANSIKKGHRCVAGKEISWDEKGWHVGDWIRPIGKPEDEGAVPMQEMRFKDGKYPEVLDIVEVPLIGPANDPNHPEDWVIDLDYYWKRVRGFPSAELSILEDEDPQIWREARQLRKVSGGFVSAMNKPASLYFISPPKGWQAIVFRKTIWSQGVPTERTKVHYLLRFSFDGKTHEFDITDPSFVSNFGHLAKAPEHGELVIPIPHSEEYFCCLSLTPAYMGYHYKILAALIKR